MHQNLVYGTLKINNHVHLKATLLINLNINSQN